MARLDLVKHQAVRFEINVLIPLTREAYDKHFGEYATWFRRSPVTFTTVYSRRKVKHHAIAFLVPEDDEGHFHFHLEYQTVAKLPTPPNSILGVGSALGILGPLVGDIELDVDLTFVYSADEYVSQLRMPIVLAEYSGGLFDEIHGFRLVKKTPDDLIEYSVIVDQPEPRLRTNILAFKYSSNLSAAGMKEILEFASELSERFIMPIEE